MKCSPTSQVLDFDRIDSILFCQVERARLSYAAICRDDCMPVPPTSGPQALLALAEMLNITTNVGPRCTWPPRPGQPHMVVRMERIDTHNCRGRARPCPQADGWQQRWSCAVPGEGMCNMPLLVNEDDLNEHLGSNEMAPEGQGESVWG